MGTIIIRRTLETGVMLLLVSVVVFFGIYAIGNPVEMFVPGDADQAERARIVATLGLDRPMWEQYFRFLLNAVRGDFGISFAHGRPTVELIMERIGPTLELVMVALVLALAIGVPAGIYAGLEPQSPLAKLIMAGSILGYSLPTFWIGLMLIMVFAVQLGWLPSSGRGDVATFLGVTSSLFTLDGLRHLLLPALTLSMFKMSLVTRLARAGTAEQINSDYARFAQAKGMPWSRLVLVHLLRNIMIPIITVLGIEIGVMVAFSMVVESIFAWPGVGKLLIDAINRLDRPVILAYIMFTLFMFSMINLAVDLLYAVLDPRVRDQQRAKT